MYTIHILIYTHICLHKLYYLRSFIFLILFFFGRLTLMRNINQQEANKLGRSPEVRFLSEFVRAHATAWRLSCRLTHKKAEVFSFCIVYLLIKYYTLHSEDSGKIKMRKSYIE